MSKKLKMIVIIAWCAAIVLTAILVPVCSYAAYTGSLRPATPNTPSRPEPEKPGEPTVTMTGIDARLRDGLAYYKGGLANVSNDDFVLTATYSDGSTAVIPSDDENILYRIPGDFREKGGTISVSYKALSDSIEVTLQEEAVARLEVQSRPNKVVYAVADTFSDEGVVLQAVYNTGRVKSVAVADCTVETAGDTSSAGEKTYVLAYGGAKAEMDYTVQSEAVTDGEPVRLVVDEGATVAVGQLLAEAAMTVKAEYADGNRKTLSEGEYSLNAETGETAVFGVPYLLEVTAGNLSADVAVRVTDTVDVTQTDRITAVGSNSAPYRSYFNYKEVDGVLTVDYSDRINLLGGLSYGLSANGNGESRVSITTFTNGACVADVDILGSSNYMLVDYGKGIRTHYALQWNAVATLKVNGKEVAIPDSAYHPGYPTTQPDEGESQFYTNLQSTVIPNVPLDAGYNEITFEFRPDVNGYRATWGNTNLVPLIKSISLLPQATSPAEKATPTELRVGSISAVPGSAVEVSAVATYADGSTYTLPQSQYGKSVLANGAAASDPTVLPSTEYTVEVTHNTLPSLTDTAAVTSEDITEIFFVDKSELLYYDDLSDLAANKIVKAVTESGKEITLAKSLYTVKAIANGEEVAITEGLRVGIGAEWKLTVEYNNNHALSDEMKSNGALSVVQTENERSRMQFAEYLTLSSYFAGQNDYRKKSIVRGYEAVNENGTVVATDREVYSLSGFSWNDENDVPKYFDISVAVGKTGTYALDLRMANRTVIDSAPDRVAVSRQSWQNRIKLTVSSGGTAVKTLSPCFDDYNEDTGTGHSLPGVVYADIDMSNAVNGVTSETYGKSIFNEYTVKETFELEAGKVYTFRFESAFPYSNLPFASFDYIKLTEAA